MSDCYKNFHLHIKLFEPNTKILTIPCEYNDKIENIIKRYRDITSCTYEEKLWRILYNGKQLEHNFTLDDYNIKKDDRIVIIPILFYGRKYK